MANGRLLAILTAVIMFAPGPGANAAFTLAELRRIEGLIISQDCGALLGYLQANPSLLEGDDPLAVELRNFNSGIRGGIIQCLSLSPGAASAVGAGTELVAAY